MTNISSGIFAKISLIRWPIAINLRKGKVTFKFCHCRLYKYIHFCSKKNRKNKGQNPVVVQEENGTSTTDGMANSPPSNSGDSGAQDNAGAEKVTGNMNLLKLKKALDEMSKVNS